MSTRYQIRLYEWDGGPSLMVAVPINTLRKWFPAGTGVVELVANLRTGRLELSPLRDEDNK